MCWKLFRQWFVLMVKSERKMKCHKCGQERLSQIKQDERISIVRITEYELHMQNHFLNDLKWYRFIRILNENPFISAYSEK